MTWTKLDDRIRTNRKIMALSFTARWVYVAGLVYCNEQLTDGRIDTFALPSIAAGVPDIDGVVKELTTVIPGFTHPLWETIDGGWQIHDFLEFNPSAAQVKAEREANQRRQAEWRKKHRNESGTYSATSTERNALRDALVTTAPYPYPNNSSSSSSAPSETVAADSYSPGVKAFLEACPWSDSKTTRDLLNALIGECEAHRKSLPAGAPGSDVTGDEWISHGVMAAVKSAKRGWNIQYLDTMLHRWMREGFESGYAQSPPSVSGGRAAEIKGQGEFDAFLKEYNDGHRHACAAS